MPSKRARSRRAVAGEVWRLMLRSAMSHMTQTVRDSGLLHDLGLTPAHVKALLMIDASVGRPMGAVAGEVGCDASTMTWLVDRLEERGLAQRELDARDRRVRTVALTPLGLETKRKLEERIFEPPAALASLDRAVLEQLHRALASLDHSAPPEMPGPPRSGPVRSTAARRAG